MNKGNWIPVDKNVLKLFPADRAYDKVEAYVSLRIDLDSGEVKGLREYARIWKWSRKKVSTFFKSVGYKAGDTEETLRRHSDEKRETPFSLIFLGLEEVKETPRKKKGDTKGTQRGHNYKTKTKEKNNKPPKSPFEGVNLPSQFDSQRFRDSLLNFYEHRKEIKAPMTVRAINGMLGQLVKFSDGKEATAIEIMERSIANGWKGVFALPKENGYTNGHPKDEPYDGTMRILNAKKTA